MRFAYADPPYLGQAKKHYGNHPDYAGEVDHAELIERMCAEFDGWALSLSMKSLPIILRLCPEDVITLAWFKPIAPPLGDHRRYNWEPVIMRPVRQYGRGYVPTALIASPPQFTFRQMPASHVIGEKPEEFARWVFASAGLKAGDEMVDLFPGSGAIGRAWEAWVSGATVSDGYADDRLSYEASQRLQALDGDALRGVVEVARDYERALTSEPSREVRPESTD
jgi:hypothetical protein